MFETMRKGNWEKYSIRLRNFTSHLFILSTPPENIRLRNFGQIWLPLPLPKITTTHGGHRNWHGLVYGDYFCMPGDTVSFLWLWISLLSWLSLHYKGRLVTLANSRGWFAWGTHISSAWCSVSEMLLDMRVWNPGSATDEALRYGRLKTRHSLDTGDVLLTFLLSSTVYDKKIK